MRLGILNCVFLFFFSSNLDAYYVCDFQPQAINVRAVIWQMPLTFLCDHYHSRLLKKYMSFFIHFIERTSLFYLLALMHDVLLFFICFIFYTVLFYKSVSQDPYCMYFLWTFCIPCLYTVDLYDVINWLIQMFCCVMLLILLFSTRANN